MPPKNGDRRAVATARVTVYGPGGVKRKVLEDRFTAFMRQNTARK